MEEKSLDIPRWLKPASESFTILGEFWHPQSPDNKLAGTLRYTPNDRVSLELLGDFTGKGVYGQLRGKNSVIMGRLQDGRKCTLLDYDAYVTTHQWEDGEHYKTDVKAIYLFVGKAFDSPESIVFDQVLLDLSHFNHWMNKPLNIDFGTPPDFNKISISKDFIGFTTNLDIASCKCIRMYPSFRHPLIASQDKGFFVDYKYHMEISPEGSLSYEKLIDLHHKITDLFTLLCAEPVYHEVLVGYYKGVPVQVYAASYNRCNPSFDKSGIDVNELPVKQSSFSNEEKLSATFKNWFVLYDGYGDFVKLLVSCFIKKSKTIEEKFLCLARCLEVFADKKCQNEYSQKQRYFQPKELETKIDAIQFPDGFNGEFKRDIKRSIRKTNSFVSLSEKLSDLLSEIPLKELYPILDNPRDGESEKKEFAAKVANSRNYYTHYGDKPEQDRFSVDELIWANDKLKMIALCLLYHHLGLEDSEFSVLCVAKK